MEHRCRNYERKTENGQIAYGTDILTRITYCLENPEHPAKIQQATVEIFHSLLTQLSESTGIDASKCAAMVVSGNTTMVHFLLGLNAWTVFAAPLLLLPLIPVSSEETNLFFDIGTNVELVIGNNHWLVAGADAAGPAPEDYISKFGMGAVSGAIDSVKISDQDLSYTTIGNEKPIGICGSGIIDLLAHMRMNGWINIAGELDPKASGRNVYLPKENQYGAVYACPEESHSGQALYFFQTDIDQYLDTKAAAFTMIVCLMESAGITAEELAQRYLFGVFPAHSDLESAIAIGVFPDIPREKQGTQ